MNYFEYIPSICPRFRSAAAICTRKFKYSLFATDLCINTFSYYGVNTKGLLIIHYHCTGLIYAEIFGKKYLRQSATIVLNLSNLTSNPEIKISFKGRRSTQSKTLVIKDLLRTNFKKFNSEIEFSSLLIEDFKLSKNKKSLGLKLSRSAITLNTPKLKFR